MTLLLVLCLVLQAAALGAVTYLIWTIRTLEGTVVDPTGSVAQIMASLEVAAGLAAGVARDLTINVAEARQQFSRLVILLDRLQTDATTAAATGERIEGAASGLNVHLEANQKADKEALSRAKAMAEAVERIEAEGGRVAEDLAELQEHARIIEAAPETPTGAAADFAAGGNDRPLPTEPKPRAPRSPKRKP